MKQKEKCSGQGFDSPHLHQKDFTIQWNEYFPPINLWNYNKFYKWNTENLFEGDALVSTGQRVKKWTTRQRESRRIGETRSQKQNK